MSVFEASPSCRVGRSGILAIIGALVIGGVPLFAQPHKSASSFEVASVRPSSPEARYMDFRVDPGGRLTVLSWTLELLIEKAYGVKSYQLSGGPAWVRAERFDIAAKADGDLSPDELGPMLRKLLKDRFQLDVRREVRIGRAFALVASKSGPKLRGSQAAERHLVRLRRRDRTSYLVGEGASMAMLADRLSELLERPVLDRTRLAGEFDFTLEFATDSEEIASSASMFTAVRQQLGLRLEATKGQVEHLTIVDVGRPVAN
jgi:uncharacterized protein (TIGR03435 family)